MLSIQHLSGGYAMNQPVIHDLSFHVQPKEIVGLIGLNGAGKSTTIRHILGLHTPFQGSITVNGVTLQQDPMRFRSSMTYIPEVPQFYDDLTLWEHLELTAKAYHIDQNTFEKRAQLLLERFRMEKVIKWFPHTFSKGMQQKIMILCALLIEPPLLIVDEPFIGLDPLATQSLLDHLVEEKQRGVSVLMSTHILGIAEKYCDRFILLHEGKIALQGTLQEMRDQMKKPNASLDDLFKEIAG